MIAKLLFVGDVFLNSDNENRMLFDESIRAIFNQSDICCCNMEGAIYTQTASKVPKIGPSLIQSSYAAKILIENGFNVYGLANNHIWDYGYLAVENTLKELRDKVVLGLSSEDIYKIIDINGVKIALFAVAEDCFGCEKEVDGGYYYFQRNDIYDWIKKAKQESDYVVMNVHAGAELFDIPLPEIRTLYKSYVDAGADLVIGHHPHILQGYEDYRDSRIYYSLGNFAFDGMNDVRSRTGAIVTVELNTEKNIVNHELYLTSFEDGIVRMKEKGTLVNELNEKIGDEETVNKWCLDMYQRVFFPIFYQGNSFGIWNGTFIERCKTAIKIIIRREKKSHLFMFHNINIDTNYWISRRALALIARHKKQIKND